MVNVGGGSPQPQPFGPFGPVVNWPNLPGNQTGANPLAQGPNPLAPGSPIINGGFVQPARGSGIVVPMQTGAGRLYNLPLEPRDEPVLGWRRYDLVMRSDEQLMLRGARVDWPEATLVAVCELDLDSQIFSTLTEMFGAKGGQVFEAYAKSRGQVRPSGEVSCEEHIRDGYCACGIYGGAMPWSTMGNGIAVCKCTAWGYVAMDEEGNWKATHARIEAIFLMKESVPYKEFFDWGMVTRRLRERYDCPVFVVDDMNEIPC